MSYTYGNIAQSGYGISISTSSSDTMPKTPPGLVVTDAVQTMDGWVGQVIVDRKIVWESDLCEDGDRAMGKANARIVEAFTKLFGPTS